MLMLFAFEIGTVVYIFFGSAALDSHLTLSTGYGVNIIGCMHPIWLSIKCGCMSCDYCALQCSYMYVSLCYLHNIERAGICGCVSEQMLVSSNVVIYCHLVKLEPCLMIY